MPFASKVITGLTGVALAQIDQKRQLKPCSLNKRFPVERVVRINWIYANLNLHKL